jgi:hypothetical protein
MGESEVINQDENHQKRGKNISICEHFVLQVLDSSAAFPPINPRVCPQGVSKTRM